MAQKYHNRRFLAREDELVVRRGGLADLGEGRDLFGRGRLEGLKFLDEQVFEPWWCWWWWWWRCHFLFFFGDYSCWLLVW